MKNYFCLKICSLPAKDEDLVVSKCFDFGAEGISEDLQFIQESDDYTPETIETPFKDICVYFCSAPPQQLLEEIGAQWPALKLELQESENKDWLEEWKKGFESFELVSGIWVVPSWLEPPSSAKVSLRIDPGMAFGTGTHETTSIMAELLYRCGDLRGQTVFDVGTGTGILAMLSAKLGAARVFGNDIDLTSVEVARENIYKNDLHSLVTVDHKEIGVVDETYDVVVANIIDGVLLKLKNDLYSKLKKNGVLLVSGILEERLADFLNKFVSPPYRVANKIQKGEWVGLRLEKE